MSLIDRSQPQRQKLVWAYYFWTIILTFCFCHLKKKTKNKTFLKKNKQTDFQAFPINTSQKWQQIHKPSCKYFLEFLFPGSPVVSLTISGELFSRVETWWWRGFGQSCGMRFTDCAFLPPCFLGGRPPLLPPDQWPPTGGCHSHPLFPKPWDKISVK